MNRRTGLKKAAWVLMTIVGILMLPFLCTGPASGGQVVKKETIMGKEYRIETIDNEPGNFMVYWGDDKEKWVPRPWYPEAFKKAGPAFYDLGEKLAKEGRFPFTLNEAMRDDNITPEQFWDASFVNNLIPIYMGDFQDSFKTEMFNVKGKKLTQGGIEFLKQYRQALEYPEGQPQRKYIFIQSLPEESSGLGMLQIVYMGKKEDDNFLYLPSVRKVRRLAVASRQDYLPRTIVRNEDNALCKPIHHYRWTGTQLAKYRGKEYPGHAMAPEGFQPDPKFQGGDHSWIEGTGEPCRIMEITPFREDWWFGKMVKLFGVKTGFAWQEDTYDQKGRLIRQLPTVMGITVEGYTEPLFHWAVITGIEQSTGYSQNAYSSECGLGVGIPDEFFREKTLLLEPSKLDAWK